MAGNASERPSVLGLRLVSLVEGARMKVGKTLTTPFLPRHIDVSAPDRRAHITLVAQTIAGLLAPVASRDPHLRLVRTQGIRNGEGAATRAASHRLGRFVAVCTNAHIHRQQRVATIIGPRGDLRQKLTHVNLDIDLALSSRDINDHGHQSTAGGTRLTIDQERGRTFGRDIALLHPTTHDEATHLPLTAEATGESESPHIIRIGVVNTTTALDTADLPHKLNHVTHGGTKDCTRKLFCIQFATPVKITPSSRSSRGATPQRREREPHREARDDTMYGGRGGPPRPPGRPYVDPRYSQTPPHQVPGATPPHGQSPYGRGYPPPQPAYAYANYHGSPTHGYSPPPQQSPHYAQSYPPHAASPYYQHQPAHYGGQSSPAPGYPPASAYSPQPAYPAHTQYPQPHRTGPPPAASRGHYGGGPRTVHLPPGVHRSKQGHFSNLSWTPASSQRNNATGPSALTSGAVTPAGAALAATTSGAVTPATPAVPTAHVATASGAVTPATPAVPTGAAAAPFAPTVPTATSIDAEDNPFRPPRDLRAEDLEASKNSVTSPKLGINFSIKGKAGKRDSAAHATPRTRKALKMVRRLKPKPTLTGDFEASDSVYYRKTGNESVVGSGTYGKVYKAVHVYTKDKVALKKIRMEGERDGFPVTAIREIKLLQSLNHHNVVDFREVMVERNDCFMIFEYLSHDLTGLLNHPQFELQPAHKKDLAKQLFEGLDYLHKRGVLHRDIKAANILVSREGELKLADFGLARFYNKNPKSKQDYTNRVITIWYRSPELLLGETQYGPAVDIWSAACVLVEIFTRHAIFPGDGGEINQLDKIYNVLGTPSREQWPGISELAWYELLRPSASLKSTFAEKYKDRMSAAAFDLLSAMFQYDPNLRPSASDVLEHPFFAVEEPKAARAVELKELQGDWHEFESKALRKEKEREARRKDREHADKRKNETPLEEEKERESKRARTDEVLP
ncbi:hypothetical protein MBLNU459_g1556t1 [Dothideomycetes sp. NU459]